MYKLIPHIFLTLVLGYLANSRLEFIKTILIKGFIALYKPNLNEAIHSDIRKYRSYNEFFTRKLKDGSRVVDNSDKAFISPVDGEIVDHGFIEEGQLIQAKKLKYALEDLVGDSYKSLYDEGYFITIYLAPTDYHRIHCPFDGTIIDSQHLGTSLFSVNKKAQESIPNLYIKNERSVLQIDSDGFNFSLVSVGASVVGSIVPFWSVDDNASRSQLINEWKRGPSDKKQIKKGDELAHFRMGSTIILLFEDSSKLDLDSLIENKLVKFGNKLVSLKNI